MLNIGNKTFMNLQEAVGWLLENNALPFQSTANYVGNTEIAMSTLINPSPAKVRVGSIIFFADSKVSTVIGVTSNSFIVSDQYNDLVDDVVYVSNVAINASGHLIVTLSNNSIIDAGLIKQVSNFSIDNSQHLIVNYNDGSTTDLGAIFSGSITIGGNLTVTGGISGNAITGDSIVENMTGYSFIKATPNIATLEYNYVGVVKNGNKITIAVACTITPSGAGEISLGQFIIPSSIGQKLFPYNAQYLQMERKSLVVATGNTFVDALSYWRKINNTTITLSTFTSALTIGTTYYGRFEITFLLGENLAS